MEIVSTMMVVSGWVMVRSRVVMESHPAWFVNGNVSEYEPEVVYVLLCHIIESQPSIVSKARPDGISRVRVRRNVSVHWPPAIPTMRVTSYDPEER